MQLSNLKRQCREQTETQIKISTLGECQWNSFFCLKGRDESTWHLSPVHKGMILFVFLTHTCAQTHTDIPHSKGERKMCSVKKEQIKSIFPSGIPHIYLPGPGWKIKWSNK